MAKSGPMALAVARALRDAPLLPRDAGGVALVKRYAALIDQAELLAEAAELIEPADEDQARRLAALARAVDAQQVASDLGPKLLAALTALGMTQAGRSVKGGGQGVTGVTGKLDELRARRARRAGVN